MILDVLDVVVSLSCLSSGRCGEADGQTASSEPRRVEEWDRMRSGGERRGYLRNVVYERILVALGGLSGSLRCTKERC